MPGCIRPARVADVGATPTIVDRPFVAKSSLELNCVNADVGFMRGSSLGGARGVHSLFHGHLHEGRFRREHPEVSGNRTLSR